MIVDVDRPELVAVCDSRGLCRVAASDFADFPCDGFSCSGSTSSGVGGSVFDGFPPPLGWVGVGVGVELELDVGLGVPVGLGVGFDFGLTQVTVS